MKSFLFFIQIIFLLNHSLSQIFLNISEASTPKALSKTAKATAVSQQAIDINNLVVWIQNNGLFASRLPDDQRGILYPKFENNELNTNKALIYSSGIIMGAMVGDSLRTIVNTYTGECQPGAINASGQPYGLSDPAFRIYKIGITPEYLVSSDYTNWPVYQGAPVDINGKPRIFGDQTLWCCFTDGFQYPIGHQNSLTLPLGAEIHLFVYAWENLDNIVFLQWKIINKSPDFWKKAYVGFFADCELGASNDDLVASDSLLKLVYVYNGDDFDEHSYEKYIPAVGYSLLQSPIIFSPGDTAILGYERRFDYKNSGVSAPLYYKHGYNLKSDNWYELHTGSKRCARDAYLRMQGLNEKNEPMIDPITGRKTNWGLSGDPIAGTGWLDIQKEDRRFMLSTGPFDMAPGDTQTVVLAITVGRGKNRLESVSLVIRATALAHATHCAPGVLYFNQITADPGTGDIHIPVIFFNPELPFSSLDFEVDFDPNYLTITEVMSTSRSINLALKLKPLSPGKIGISVQRLDQNIMPASTPLLILTGKISSQTPKGSLEINCSQISAWDLNQQLKTVPGFAGSIIINRRPDDFRLLSPPNQYPIETFEAIKSITFSWNNTHDLDNDSLSYKLMWLDQVTYAPLSYFTISDTVFRFNGQGFFQMGKTYLWTVEAFDDQQGKASQDTFSLVIGKLNKLLRVNQFHLPDTKRIWLDKIRIDRDILYLLGMSEVDSNLRDVIYRYQLTDPAEPIFLDKYLFPYPHGIDAFIVQNGYGYLAGYFGNEGTELLVFDFSKQVPWEVVTRVPLFLSSPMLQINQNYLTVWTDDPESQQVIFYDLTNRLLPQYKFSLKLPYPMNNRYYKLQNDDLYFAGKDFSGNYTFKIYRLNAAFQPVDSTSMNLIGRVNNLFIDDKFAYVSIDVGSKYWENYSGSEVYIIDISDNQNPEVLSFIPTLWEPRQLFRLNSQKLLLNHYQVLDVYNLQQPENPVQISHYYGLESFIALKESYIYGVQMPDELVILDGEKSIPPEDDIDHKTQLFVDQNFPNPFHTETLIRYFMPESGKLTLEIFDVLGRLVRRFERIITEPDYYYISWDGKSGDDRICAAGIYFYRLRMGKKIEVKKMVKF